MLQLREHQLEVVVKIEDGFTTGHRCQLLYAPTGFGKTEVAMAIMQEVADKYKKTAMVLDRIVLVNQTSTRLSRYGINHGVMQADHWRYRPQEKIQICSAQTLEKRENFPSIDLLIIDECHVQRKSVVQYIKSNPQTKVIGLTATPFTAGLGDVYTNVVGAKSTGDLIDKGWLTPLKIYIAKEIDMTDAKKVAGEWSQDEVTERGMKITGDIVAEWVKKTNEIFGAPRKTVVFCSGVAHGRDLERQFNELGYNFKSISYLEDDDYKKDIIEEFGKPDTDITGLIATDILTRGFDVPDVMIGVSARPFSKSFSSHVQQMGRIMRPYEGKQFGVWLCLAKGSRVLTDKGLVSIDKVTITHKIWDGTNFVTHGGSVCNGTQNVITYQGLTATAGHLVHTSEGWRTFGDCAAQQIRITQTGLGRQAIRLGHDLRTTSFLVGRTTAQIHARFVRVRNLWIQKFNFLVQFAVWENQGMSGVQPAGRFVPNVAIQPSTGNEGSLQQPLSQSLLGVWRKGRGVSFFWRQGGDLVDYAISWVAKVFNSSREISCSVGQNRSKWALRARKFAMAICGVESAEQARQSSRGAYSQVQIRASRDSLLRRHFETFLLGWHDGRSNHSTFLSAIHEAKREVWDILDAGQHNRFTCEGLLVHNCHSGNYLRFRKDWDKLFDEGVTELKSGGESTKKEPTEKEKKESKCPACGALWRWFSNVCGECGHEKPIRGVSSVAGELTELEATARKNQAENQNFYSELLQYAKMRDYKEGWAAHKYKEKYGIFPPRGLQKTYRSPSLSTVNFIKSRQIAWSKARAA